MATFADDTAVMAIGETVDMSTRKLQSAVNKIAIWTRKWRIKLNESKSVHIDFTNNKIKQQSIFIHGTKVPYANTAKYLGMTLDAKLRWKEHIKKKRDELNIKFRKMYWLLGRNSELSVHNKLTLYKQVICPVWSYGI
jgi:predicted GIY-YIG superfamily endonuclease